VDGTNGDTWLQPVHATLGESRFTAEGKIVRVPAEALPNGSARPGGREIALNVIVGRGRMEDFLRLVSKSGTPLMTGVLTLRTTLEIPPGTEPVQEKMKLNGNFNLEDAAFTSAKIQNEVRELKRRTPARTCARRSRAISHWPAASLRFPISSTLCPERRST
jgi:hypothetical protein